MKILRHKFSVGAAVLVAAFLFAEPAAAFRCGSKLVRDGMHEAQVVAICGQPMRIRNLGVTLRSLDYEYSGNIGPGWTEYHSRGGRGYAQEVIITEYVYNFGPRKLMRRLLFEGGVLVTIETLGYGHRE
jgi:hypothetical protein